MVPVSIGYYKICMTWSISFSLFFLLPFLNSWVIKKLIVHHNCVWVGCVGGRNNTDEWGWRTNYLPNSSHPLPTPSLSCSLIGQIQGCSRFRTSVAQVSSTFIRYLLVSSSKYKDRPLWAYLPTYTRHSWKRTCTSPPCFIHQQELRVQPLSHSFYSSPSVCLARTP